MMFILVFISLSILIVAHECGHFFAAKIFGVRVEEFGFGYPPRLFGKKIGKTLWSVNALPFGGFVKIKGEDEGKNINSESSSDSFAAQPAWKRVVILLSGVFMNFVAGFLIFSAVFMIGSSKGVAVTDVSNNSPAYEAGIKKGDVVMSASAKTETISSLKEVSSFITFINRHKGEDVTLSVKRASKTYSYTLLAREHPPKGEGSLGVQLIELGIPKAGFFQAIGNAFRTTLNITGMVAISFVTLFAKIFVAPQVLQSIAGPVGIFSIAGEAGNFGIVYLLELLGIISLNLAVLNCIPFPALDGGRVLLVFIEKIKGSPVSLKSQKMINALGFAALLIIMVLVTIQDVSRIIH